MGVINQLALPFFALNAVLFVFLLWTFLYLQPWSGTFTVGILAGIFLIINMAASLLLVRSDIDI